YFGGDVTMLESEVSDALQAFGHRGISGSLAMSESIADYILAAGSVASSGGGGDSLSNDPYPDYTSFHVDLENGSDSNSGLSEGSPKRTIQAALALVTNPASRVLVRG